MWKQPGGRFRSYYVPTDLDIPGYGQKRMWCSTLIRGWREFASKPVHEIAFEQWRQYVDAVEEARLVVPSGQWVDGETAARYCDPPTAVIRAFRTREAPGTALSYRF